MNVRGAYFLAALAAAFGALASALVALASALSAFFWLPGLAVAADADAAPVGAAFAADAAFPLPDAFVGSTYGAPP